MLVDAISQDVRNELPWELLYADDLAIIDVTSRPYRYPKQTGVMAEGLNKQWSEDQFGKYRTSVNKGKSVANQTEWRRTE